MPKVDLSHWWQLFSTNASVIQTVAIILALAYASVQTRQLGRQLRLSQILGTSLHYTELNKQILENDTIGKLFGTDKPETLQRFAAAQVFGTFEARYFLHRAGLLDRQTWHSDILTMIKGFEEHAFLGSAWQVAQNEYDARFRRFINTKVLGITPSWWRKFIFWKRTPK